MTEQERISREALLERAAAAAGAIYVAPVLASTAAAEVNRRCKRISCAPGSAGDAKCRGKGCMCCDPRTGKCSKQRSRCCTEDRRCPRNCPGPPRDVCNDAGTCMCFVLAGSQNCENECVDFPSGFCSDYPPCNRSDGSGCPPGMCCLDTQCGDGICSTPCGTVPAPKVNWHTGSGPRLTL